MKLVFMNFVINNYLSAVYRNNWERHLQHMDDTRIPFGMIPAFQRDAGRPVARWSHEAGTEECS